MLRRLALTLPLIAALASPGDAQTIIRGTSGLAGLFTSFDFNGLPIESGNSVDHLEGGLVAFEGAYYGSPAGPLGGSYLFGTDAIYNYTVSQLSDEVFTVRFTMRASGVAFNFGSGLARTTFRAYLGDQLIGTIDTEQTGYPIGTTGPNRLDGSLFAWWGFDFVDGVTTFDRITITSTPHPGGGPGNVPAQPSGFGLDNLQVRVAETVTPEPGTVALAALGLMALGTALRLRTRRDQQG